MTSTDPQAELTLAAIAGFLADVHLAAPGDVPDAAARAAEHLGWSARLYLADPEQEVLVPLPTTRLRPAQPVTVEGTLAGRAFTHVEPVVAHSDELTVWLPLLDGVHRFGVVELRVPAGTDVDSSGNRDTYRMLAHLFGHLVAAKRPYGDATEIHTRRRERSVPTELLADLLPPSTFGCPGLVISGLLEPCYDVAADAFDYSVIGDTAHLAIFDATGHDLSGTLVAAVALAAYRNSRREGRSLYETARTLDDHIRDQWRAELFATAVLAELDLPSGRLRYINAGHPSPLLVRRGKVVKQLEGGRRIVLGLGHGEIEVAEESLEPDDWVVLYTDGITEARDTHGRFYGVEGLADQLSRSAADGYPAPETLRRVIREVRRHQGQPLKDDATVLVAHWASGEEAQLFAAPAPP
jgi:phosphoserine phosphatase RsbU/P